MIIPQSILNNNYKSLVHVENWNKGYVFRYLKTENGIHHLESPKNRKQYKTNNNLIYTKKNEPNCNIS